MYLHDRLYWHLSVLSVNHGLIMLPDTGFAFIVSLFILYFQEFMVTCPLGSLLKAHTNLGFPGLEGVFQPLWKRRAEVRAKPVGRDRQRRLLSRDAFIMCLAATCLHLFISLFSERILHQQILLKRFLFNMQTHFVRKRRLAQESRKASWEERSNLSHMYRAGCQLLPICPSHLAAHSAKCATVTSRLEPRCLSELRSSESRSCTVLPRCQRLPLPQTAQPHWPVTHKRPFSKELSLCLRPIHWCWTRAIRWAWRYSLEPSPICGRQTQPGWLFWFPACSDGVWDSASPRFGLVLFASGFNFYFEWFWLLNVWKRLFICFSSFLFSIEIGRVVSQFIYQAWFHNLWQSRSGTTRGRQDLGIGTWRLVRSFCKP